MTMSGSIPALPSTRGSQRRRPRGGDPSLPRGNPGLINLSEVLDEGAGPSEEAAASAPLSYSHTMQLEKLDRSSRLSHWMSAFSADEEAFASKAVFVEMRLRQALSSSITLGVPNTFRCAVVCDAFERVAPMTGRYEGVLVLIWKELVRAIYLDYTADLPGSGAKAYAERTPYFLEARRLKEAYEASEKAIKRLQAAREAELEAVQGRNQLINKTLASWNRALGAAGNAKEVEELKARLEELARMLAEANAEVEKLSAEAYRPPLEKCLSAFEECDDAQKEEALLQHLMPHSAAASCVVGHQTFEVADAIGHLLSMLPQDEFAKTEDEATRSRVLTLLLGTINIDQQVGAAPAVAAPRGRLPR